MTDSDGYTIIRPLGDGLTLLARDASGRQIVLKPLPSDCLLAGQLHPSIRLRLLRLRELADTAVANFHGVVHERGNTFLVWEFITGRTIEQARDVDETWLARELRLAVRTLHVRGIVHGALHDRNALIDESGRLRLTHLSPLLYDDPVVDDRAVEAILLRRDPSGTGEAPQSTKSASSPSSPRGRALLAATAAAVAGILLTWWIARIVTHSSAGELAPRSSRAGDWVSGR
jgi:hypothetical protein